MVFRSLHRSLRVAIPIMLALAVTLATPATFLSGGDTTEVVAKNKNKKKSKTINRTFSNGAEIGIDDFQAADPFPSTIQVSGFKKAKVRDVNVVLRDYQHTFPDDVDVLLVSPEGESAFIMSDVGTNGDLFDIGGITLTLDDEAEDPLPDFNSLITGTFRPTNGDPDLNGDESGDDFPPPAPEPGGSALSVFDGMNPNGEWQLFVVDDRSGDAGFFGDGWSLVITARIKKK
jgi:subtilisin-like proprotein convertase family protein